MSSKFKADTLPDLKRVNPIAVVPLLLEVIVHIEIYKRLDFSSFIYSGLIALTVGLVLSALCSLFPKVVNIVLSFVFAGVMTVYFIAQVIYLSVFDVFMSMYTALNVGTDALQFREMFTKAITSNLGNIIFMFLPIAGMIVLAVLKITDYTRPSRKALVIRLGGAVACYLIFSLALLPSKKEDMGAYDLYRNEYSDEEGVETLGMLVYMRHDIAETIYYKTGIQLEKRNTGEFVAVKFTPTPTPTPTYTPTPTNTPTPAPTRAPEHTPTNTPTPTDTPTPTPTPVDRSPQVLNIDFGAIAAEESDKDLKFVDEYFAAEIPSNKNEFTGMFKGYNLIFITAEAWSPLAVSEEVTPTLYKMIHSCFDFTNFYNPLWYTSTVDGEFAGISGLLPEGKHNGRRCSMTLDDLDTAEDESAAADAKKSNNAMPYALGNVFKRNGYKTYAYHNHTFDYYQRNAILSCFGYDTYRGMNGGTILGKTSRDYALKITKMWPQSDLEMMQNSVSEYLDEWKKTGQPFHTYYMTVSGHTNYTVNGNSMVARHFDEMADLPYSDMLKGYIAANYELELAINSLIEQLTEAGALEKTVIVINADHYPYGLKSAAENENLPENTYFSEFYGHEVDMNYEVYKNHLVIWNAGMEETYVVDKTACPVDIVPTLLNLFGIEFDSRLLMGRDILSDYPGFVIFKGTYKYMTDTFTRHKDKKVIVQQRTDAPVSDAEVSMWFNETANRYKASKIIIDKDYFSKIMPLIP